MSTPDSSSISDSLWSSILQRTQSALACGALQSIPTVYEFVEDGEICFLVRILANIARKEADQIHQAEKAAKTGKDFNPFLPYEPELFVADLSPTHVCLLNKFNVVDHHILMVTRTFESQDTWLTLADFETAASCLQTMDGLVFYNGGRDAGASQPHKHLQWVPFPLMPDGSDLPIHRAIAPLSSTTIDKIPQWKFRHGVMKWSAQLWQQPCLEIATQMLAAYQQLLAVVGFPYDSAQVQQTGAYNLLITREWMLLVGRSQEQYQSIGVNSLGFSGALLVRDAQQLDQLKAIGPMNLLNAVALP
jgi:ATP adenylyltransferase